MKDGDAYCMKCLTHEFLDDEDETVVYSHETLMLWDDMTDEFYCPECNSRFKIHELRGMWNEQNR